MSNEIYMRLGRTFIIKPSPIKKGPPKKWAKKNDEKIKRKKKTILIKDPNPEEMKDVLVIDNPTYIPI